MVSLALARDRSLFLSPCAAEQPLPAALRSRREERSRTAAAGGDAPVGEAPARPVAGGGGAARPGGARRERPVARAAPAAREPRLPERGDRAAGLQVLDSAVAAGSYSAEVFLERGLIEGEAGRVEEALRDFREAARRNPIAPVPLENAARAAYRLGRHREAVQLYEQLLRLQPDRLDAWKTAGALYLYELKDEPDALRCFRRALILEVDPAEKQKLEALVGQLGG